MPLETRPGAASGGVAIKRGLRLGIVGLAVVGGIWIRASALSPATVIQSVVRSKEVRVTLLSQVTPRRLPRHQPAPISVFVGGHVDPVGEGLPPQLRALSVDVSRFGVLRSSGLSVCGIKAIQPATTAEALERCGDAIVGSGQFWAHIFFPDQGAYPTHGRVLVFNGLVHGHHALLTHIYSTHPFASSFVIPFTIHHLKGGAYGTRLTASLPHSLGDWGYVDRIKLTLRRNYRVGRRERSFFNASCPAPAGTRLASYELARATFDFGGRSLSVSVPKSCGVLGR